MSDHWALALYERYVQLYGEPIEHPMSPRPSDPHDNQKPTALPVKQNSTG